MSPPPITEEYPIAAAGKVYDGQIMCFGGGGKLSNPDAAANLVFAGVTLVDTEIDAQADEAIRVGADMLIWLPLAGANQASVGKRLYATDNNLFTLASAQRKSIGLIRQWSDGMVKVDTSKADAA